ncbi:MULTISPECIES: FecCD family ABC transporter permease [Staphylococcus]|uniref:Probable heme-iron transport system permease protein IsdF n=3 Tax=Bacilli TaxID=91061 RepID=A0ABD4EK42_STALU|nr:MULTISPECIES: iron ABC transporter permease [Staphylococcus]ADC86223.1 Heme transporter IsdDEF, permease component IsdF [Staphylococcus lugdunensis HKU09-01]ADC86252.1 Siderophore staphylobactin ABC transporter, permease protein SirB [Staphylococcus lugdunensis HKU09-01]ARB78819.1 iron ABC transporter permease [Staphylococcus lugdunensis]ARJ08010.1 iron-siderophore ABC transporter permease [Staphylococcus lugdunensis]ARJ15101.1 iron-siderophore ABC transporter permease [Staphylococcus lugdu
MLLKPKYQIALAGFCLVIVAISSLMIGNTLVSPMTLIQALFNFDSANELHHIVTGTRTSRTIIALLTGAALAIAGLLMQALTRNPIASPGLFGVNAGAVFFVILSITFFQIQSFKVIIVIAFLGAIIVTILVVTLGMFRQTQFSPQRVILAGAAISMLFTAFTQGILIMNETDLQGLLFWLSGSVSLRNIWDMTWIIPLILILILIAFSMGAHINILMTSDDIATGLGQNIRVVKWLIILLISMLASISVAVAGSIAFIGLIVPNISKRLLPPNYKYLIPFNALAGANLMLLSDMIARVIIQPLELPIGVVTAIMGASVLIYLMQKGPHRL